MSLVRIAASRIYRVASDRYYTLRFLRLKRELALLQSHGTIAPNKLFHDISDDFWFWLNTAGYRKSKQLQEILPSLPSAQEQVRFTGSSGDSTLREAFSAYSLFKKEVNTYTKGINDLASILDFGCGWGRLLRFFLKDIDPSRLWGIDALSEIIEICQRTNKWCHFEVTNSMPPTRFADETFDLIYCYSVFSHLSEDAHKRWLTEFKRLLRPGGLFIATTRPREFILQCAEVRKQTRVPVQSRGVAQSFLDTDKSLADYDNGLFCHSPTGGGGALDESFYGETCIPKTYVLNHWAEHFTFLDFVPATHRLPQNVIVVRK